MIDFRTTRGWIQREGLPFREEVGEINTGEVLVERDGYIPRSEKIRNFLDAGERLAQWRREMYHYGPDEEDDGFVDPVDKYQATDLVDEQEAIAMQQEIEEAVKEQESRLVEASKSKSEELVEPAQASESDEKTPE